MKEPNDALVRFEEPIFDATPEITKAFEDRMAVVNAMPLDEYLKEVNDFIAETEAKLKEYDNRISR
jgi:hypothetical protein